MTLLELSDQEKNMFMDWLQQREKAILEEINLLKTLRLKLEDTSRVIKTFETKHIKQPSLKKEVKPPDESLSWVNVIKNELGNFTHPVPSGDIVKRLLQKPFFSEKGRRFITKAVTSKLWLLQERGEVSKTRENGRYVYILKK